MLCQRCKKNQATTHIKSIMNGKLTEFDLCDECAKEMGYTPLSSHFSIDNILGGLFNTVPSVIDQEQCPCCGATLREITKTGKVGCMQCYETFYDKLIPMIQRIHGTTVHKGKSPGKSAMVIQNNKSGIAVSDTSELEQKKLQLKNAIEEQRFEDAAKLRDEIKELENHE